MGHRRTRLSGNARRKTLDLSSRLLGSCGDNSLHVVGEVYHFAAGSHGYWEPETVCVEGGVEEVLATGVVEGVVGGVDESDVAGGWRWVAYYGQVEGMEGEDGRLVGGEFRTGGGIEGDN